MMKKVMAVTQIYSYCKNTTLVTNLYGNRSYAAKFLLQKLQRQYITSSYGKFQVIICFYSAKIHRVPKLRRHWVTPPYSTHTEFQAIIYSYSAKILVYY